MTRTSQIQRKRIEAIWSAVCQMIDEHLSRFASRYPRSPRLPILRELREAAEREDETALAAAGLDYLRLTRMIPPGCYGIRRDGTAEYFLSGHKIGGRLNLDQWSIHRYSPQVWR